MMCVTGCIGVALLVLVVLSWSSMRLSSPPDATTDWRARFVGGWSHGDDLKWMNLILSAGLIEHSAVPA